jgi:DNA-nicking Smr family endonuclease
MRLKRGGIAPEAEIDLHHMTQAEAHARLSRFLGSAQASGRRCVLVITGKGYGTGGTIGVLKSAVPRWLNEPELRARVLAIAHAPPERGGDGALMVLLKRPRPGGRERDRNDGPPRSRVRQ